MPEIFDFQLFPIVKSQKFFTVKNRPKILPTFNSQQFCKNKSKILQKDQTIKENGKNSGIFSTFLTFDSICWKLTVYFRHFWHMYQKNIRNMPWKKSQNGPNLIKNVKNYTIIFDISTHIFGLSKMYRNVPTFDFRLSWYNFAKMYRSSKILW